ncbi:MAG: hypothetical protein ACXIUD_18565 [Mongoliitalea sp.]
MVVKFSGILCCLLLMFSVGFAQDSEEVYRWEHPRPDYDRGINAYIIFPAFTMSSPASINQLLNENGYPVLPRGHLNLGFGLNYRINRLMVITDLFWGNQLRTTPGDDTINQTTRRMTWSGNFGFAYHVIRTDGGAVYPFIAYSFTETTLFLSKSTSSTSLDNMLSNPGNSVHLNNYSNGLFIGIGMDAHDLFLEDSIIGSIRIGKRIQTNPIENWSSRYTQLSNSPLDSFNYWQVQLSIGGAFNWDRKKK